MGLEIFIELCELILVHSIQEVVHLLFGKFVTGLFVTDGSVFVVTKYSTG